MATVRNGATRRKSRAKRPHNPELLRCKRAARALGIPWSAVTAERDRLRRVELEEREPADALHRAAAVYFGGKGAAPFWRGFFRRKFAKLIAEGGDYTSVPGFDLFVAGYYRPAGDMSSEAVNAGDVTNGWSPDDAWELLIEDRPPLRSVWELYDQAVRTLAAQTLVDSQLGEAVERLTSGGFVGSETPF